MITLFQLITVNDMLSDIGTPVGLTGLEPVTPALSAQCSNRLSYRPDPSAGFYLSH